MLRLVPPAGTPMSAATVLGSLLRRIVGSRSDFVDQVAEYVGAQHVFAVNSGRAAQVCIIKAMQAKSKNERDEIVVPAYTCYTVPASVVRAGCKVRAVDVVPETMDYDPEALRRADLSRTLAINSSNLFGIVSDWEVINEVAQRNGCYTIDDAAQSFGEMADGKHSGLLGDAGFFSLDRGKNLSTYSGGIVVTGDDEIADSVREMIQTFGTSGLVGDVATTVKLLAYALLSRPRLFWIPSSLPFLGLGETIYDESIEVEKLPRLQEQLGQKMIEHLTFLNKSRAITAAKLANPLHESGKYIVPGYEDGADRAYLRLPVLAPDRPTRDKALEKLRKSGIGASRMYPGVIPDIPELDVHLAPVDDSCAGAREITERLFTLPTNYYVTADDISKMLEILL